MPVWHGMWVPRGTPKDIIGQLNTAVVETLADPVVRQRLADLGQEIFPREQQTPEALGAFHRAEIEKWWPIHQDGGHHGRLKPARRLEPISFLSQMTLTHQFERAGFGSAC